MNVRAATLPLISWFSNVVLVLLANIHQSRMFSRALTRSSSYQRSRPVTFRHVASVFAKTKETFLDLEKSTKACSHACFASYLCSSLWGVDQEGGGGIVTVSCFSLKIFSNFNLWFMISMYFSLSNICDVSVRRDVMRETLCRLESTTDWRGLMSIDKKNDTMSHLKVASSSEWQML